MKALPYQSQHEPLIEAYISEVVEDAVFGRLLYSNKSDGTAYEHPKGYIFCACSDCDWRHGRPVYVKLNDEAMRIVLPHLLVEREISCEIIPQRDRDGNDAGTKLYVKAFGSRCLVAFPKRTRSLEELGVTIRDPYAKPEAGRG